MVRRLGGRCVGGHVMSTSAPHRRSAEPFLWLLFSAGGMAAALVLPVLLFLFGVAFPLGLLDAPDHAHLLAVVRHPVTKLVLLGVCVLALFHFAHRIRFTIEHGLQLGRFDRVIALCCYGTAVLISAAAIWVLITA
jgi:fumarate reductase subunit D